MTVQEHIEQAAAFERAARLAIDGGRRRDLWFRAGRAYEAAATLRASVQEDAADAPELLRRAALLAREAASRYRASGEPAIASQVGVIADQLDARAAQLVERRRQAELRDRQFDRAVNAPR